MKGRLSYFLISLLVLLVFFPFLEGGGVESVLLTLLFTLALFFGVYAVSHNRHHVGIALLLGLPWLGLSWGEILVTQQPFVFSVSGAIVGTVFFLFVAGSVLNYVLKALHVSWEIIAGAIAVYILVGIVCSVLYVMFEHVSPGSFYIVKEHNLDGLVTWSDLVYYSFATLTTLGYGDIVPITWWSRLLSMFEVMFGVFYIAVFVSRLVAHYRNGKKYGTT